MTRKWVRGTLAIMTSWLKKYIFVLFIFLAPQFVLQNQPNKQHSRQLRTGRFGVPSSRLSFWATASRSSWTTKIFPAHPFLIVLQSFTNARLRLQKIQTNCSRLLRLLLIVVVSQNAVLVAHINFRLNRITNNKGWTQGRLLSPLLPPPRTYQWTKSYCNVGQQGRFHMVSLINKYCSDCARHLLRRDPSSDVLGYSFASFVGVYRNGVKDKLVWIRRRVFQHWCHGYLSLIWHPWQSRNSHFRNVIGNQGP